MKVLASWRGCPSVVRPRSSVYSCRSHLHHVSGKPTNTQPCRPDRPALALSRASLPLIAATRPMPHRWSQNAIYLALQKNANPLMHRICYAACVPCCCLHGAAVSSQQSHDWRVAGHANGDAGRATSIAEQNTAAIKPSRDSTMKAIWKWAAAIACYSRHWFPLLYARVMHGGFTRAEEAKRRALASQKVAHILGLEFTWQDMNDGLYEDRPHIFVCMNQTSLLEPFHLPASLSLILPDFFIL